MTLTGSSYAHRAGQIETNPQTDASDRGYLVFTDAVSPRDDLAPSTGSQAAAALAEQALHDYLSGQVTRPLTEETLRSAFAEANRRVIELFGSDDDEVAVSAIVLTEEENLLVAGVGDIALFAVRPGQSERIFADPQTPSVVGKMSAEERHLSLHNAIGTGDEVQVHFERHTPATFERYVAASYGLLSEAGEEAIRELGAVPEEAVAGVLQKLRLSGSVPHSLAMAFAVRQQASIDSLATAESPTLHNIADQARRSRERKLALAISGVTCSLVLFVIFQMAQSDEEPTLSTTAPMLVEATPTEENDSWVAALKEQLRTKELELAESKDEVRLLRQSGANADESRELMKELAQSNEDLRQLRAKASTLTQKLEAREERVEDLELTISALEERLSSSGKPTSTPKGGAELRRMEREITKLKDSLAEKEEILASTKETNRDYAERYRKLESQLTSKLDDVSRSYEREQDKQTSMRHELAERVRDLTTKLNEQVGRNRSLTAELHQLQQLAQARPSSGSTGNSGELKALQNEVATLKTAYDQENRRNQILKEELQAALEGDNGAESNQLARELQREQETSRAVKAELNATLAKLDDLSQELAAARNSAGNSDREADRRTQELARNLEKEQQRSALLQQELEDVLAAAARERSAAQQEITGIAALRDELAESKQEVARLKSNKAVELSEVEQALTTLQDKSAKALVSAEQALSTLKENSSKELAAAEQTIASMKESQARADENAEKRYSKMERERNSLLDEKASLMEKITAMEQFQDLYQTERALREAKEKEFAAFQSKLSEQKEMLATIEVSRNAMASELQKMRREYNSLLKQRRASRRATAEVEERASEVVRPALRTATPSRPATPVRESRQVAADPGTRVHIVSRGETLSGIAMRYYGSSKYWTDIYNANQESIADTKRVKVGTPLVIPSVNEAKKG